MNVPRDLFRSSGKLPPARSASTTGGKVMAVNPSKSLADVLRQIRDSADAALRELESMEKPRHLGWRCTSCGETKHFTRPVPPDVAPPCPRCSGSTFTPI